MNESLLLALKKCETDIDGVKNRFCGNETLYISCLKAFLSDPTMNEFTEAVNSQMWDQAFTAIHALKGVAGNMGFVPLFYASSEMLIQIRSGRLNEIKHSYEKLLTTYDEIVKVIHNYCIPE